MFESKKIFQDNVKKLVEKKQIPSGRALAEMTQSGGRKGIDHTYANKILKSPEPVNITLDKIDDVAYALGVDVVTLLSPFCTDSTNMLDPKTLPLDEQLLEESKREIRAVAEEFNIEDMEFLTKAEVFYYKSKVEGLSSLAIGVKINQLATSMNLNTNK